MKIIFNDAAAQDLMKNHVILELDVMPNAAGQPVKIYSLLDNIPVDKMSVIPEFCQRHHEFLTLYQQQQYQSCQILLKQLRDYDLSDMNSYYDVMAQRIEKILQCQNTNK